MVRKRSAVWMLPPGDAGNSLLLRLIKREWRNALRLLRPTDLLAEACGERFAYGVVLYDSSDCVPFGDRLAAAPVSCLWG
jgi:hypothetical protein